MSNSPVLRPARLFLLAFLLIACAEQSGWIHAQQRPASETLLPAATRAWMSIPDAVGLVDQFNATGPGRLFMSAEMTPAIESLRAQIEQYIEKQNIRLGIGWEDIHNVRSGEVCLAGVVLPAAPGQVDQIVRGSHGVVLLVDVSGNEVATEVLLEKVTEEMKKHGAEPESMGPVQGVEISKWRWPAVNGGLQRFTLIMNVEGWLVASDNEAVLREVLARIQGRAADRLADVAAFQSVVEHVALPGLTPHVRWFVEPFGYVELAQAIYDENRPFVERRNDYAKILRQQGFDVLNGLGGMVALNQSDRDIVQRTFISLVPVSERHGDQTKVSNLFDFENRWGHELVPETFAVEDASNYFTFTWHASNLLDNVDGIFDAFFYEGYYEKMINGLREDGIDVVEAAKLLDNRFTLISKVRQPVEPNSECVAIVIRVKERPEALFDFVRRFVNEGRMVQEGEWEYLLIDRSVVASDEPEVFDPTFAQDPADFGKLENEGTEQPFNLFGTVYVTVRGGHLMICNDRQFMMELVNYQQSNLAVTADYRQVALALDQLGIKNERVVTRGFGRLDRMIESNYQMFRQNKMPSSESMLARILNRAFQSADDPASERAQKFDGSLLPEDFQQQVAPFLGPSGWAMEQLADGWLISGVLLKKNEVSEVAERDTTDDKSVKK